MKKQVLFDDRRLYTRYSGPTKWLPCTYTIIYGRVIKLRACEFKVDQNGVWRPTDNSVELTSEQLASNLRRSMKLARYMYGE